MTGTTTLAALACAERGGDLVVVSVGEVGEFAQQLLTAGGQPQLVDSTVVVAAAAAHQAALFELVDQRHHSTGSRAEVLGEAALADARLVG